MDRSHLKAAYKHLYDEVEEILFRHDPVGINFGDNTDEYDPEVGAILPRLNEACSEADVQEIVYEEFVRLFDVSTAGRKDSQPYKAAAREIWTAWLRFSKEMS